jgi:outer membrane protein OmpA-like peptidoglycan-associated protein
MNYISTRAALTAGYLKKRASGLLAEPYAEVSYRYEFDGEGDIGYGGAGFESDLSGGVLEGALGVNWQLGKDVYAYAQGSYEKGSKVEAFGGNLGIRLGFGGKKAIEDRPKAEEEIRIEAAEPKAAAEEIKAVKEAEPQKEAIESSRKARLAVGRTFRIEGDQFPFPSNSDIPPAALKEHIKEKAGELKGLSYSKVIVTGYTDSTGKVDYNNDLSKRRAEAVRTEFIKNGIYADKVETIGKGPQSPIAGNKTAEGRKANRRVEITVK